MAQLPMYGGIEGGGTKFVCAVASAPDRILERATFPTADPTSTLGECVRFFASAQQRHGRISAFGFSCFGPVELRQDSPRYGRMMATPKSGWSEVSLLEPLQGAFAIPIALDTDVAGAALAEWQMGAGRGAASLAYVTVGTGIGGAVVPTNPAATRLMHAEMGHLQVRRDPRDQGFSGVCPFHGDCLEGLASGPAIRARWGCMLESLAPEHPAWSIIGGYLAQLAAAIALMCSVQKIVFGGGVLSNGALLPHISAATFEYLNGYLQPLNDARHAAGYICGPALGGDAGITGALLMAAKWVERTAS
jgi:fructokinase